MRVGACQKIKFLTRNLPMYTRRHISTSTSTPHTRQSCELQISVCTIEPNESFWYTIELIVKIVSYSYAATSSRRMAISSFQFYDENVNLESQFPIHCKKIIRKGMLYYIYSECENFQTVMTFVFPFNNILPLPSLQPYTQIEWVFIFYTYV